MNRMMACLIVASVCAGCDLFGSDVNGDWGGVNVSATLSPQSTRLVFACAAATLPPIPSSQRDRFVLVGVDTIYEGPAHDALNVLPTTMIRVAGSIHGDQMSIDVSSVSDSSATATHFDLTRGSPAKITLVCRT